LKPKPERSLVANKVYQAFLSFNGHPGPAYSRPGSVIAPNTPAHEQVAESRDLDAILVAGLIERYEDAVKPSKGDPYFADFWKQWAIAMAGHYFKYLLRKEDQWALKQSFLSAKGPDHWRKLRKYFLGLMKDFLGCFPADTEAQKVFKNGDDEWKNAEFKTVKPKDIWPYIRQEVRENSFDTMRARQRQHAIGLEYYDVDFAILAHFMNLFVESSPPPKISSRVRRLLLQWNRAATHTLRLRTGAGSRRLKDLASAWLTQWHIGRLNAEGTSQATSRIVRGRISLTTG